VIQFNRQIKTERQVSLFAMNKITQTMLYRQSIMVPRIQTRLLIFKRELVA
jgi:hypothetical protein